MACATEDSSTDLNDFIFTQIPSESSSDIDHLTQCIVRSTLIHHLFSLPGFPVPSAHPEIVCHRIGLSRHGHGVFATQRLSMGDLILTERPLTLTPTYLRIPEVEKDLEGLSPESRRRLILKTWENRYLIPLISRLSAKEKTDFMALANCHSDSDIGNILGVIRTNGLDPIGLCDPATGDQYAAICKTLSRINHSCSPSTHYLFDVPSFTFQLRAARNIEKDEEIFISYCYVLDPASTRREELAEWNFSCTCNSCLTSTEKSDQLRLGISKSMKAINSTLQFELKNSTLQNELAIQESLHWIAVIEEEGLESTEAYRSHLKIVFDAYTCLGKFRLAAEFGVKFSG